MEYHDAVAAAHRQAITIGRPVHLYHTAARPFDWRTTVYPEPDQEIEHTAMPRKPVADAPQTAGVTEDELYTIQAALNQGRAARPTPENDTARALVRGLFRKLRGESPSAAELVERWLAGDCEDSERAHKEAAEACAASPAMAVRVTAELMARGYVADVGTLLTLIEAR